MAAGLGIGLPEAATPFRPPVDLPPSDALSIQKNWRETLTGRKIGPLIAEGSDKASIDSLVAAVEAEGGRVFSIAPKIGPMALKGGADQQRNGQLAGSPSVLFDAAAMILMPDQAEKLAKDSAAIGFVMDAYAHLKAIGHCRGSAVILDPRRDCGWRGRGAERGPTRDGQAPLLGTRRPGCGIWPEAAPRWPSMRRRPARTT